MGIVHHVMRRRERLFRAMSMDENPTGRAVYRRDLTSEEKRICRHMAWKSATLKEMAEAIKWPLGLASLRKKLNAINIKTPSQETNYLHRVDTR